LPDRAGGSATSVTKILAEGKERSLGRVTDKKPKTSAGRPADVFSDISMGVAFNRGRIRDERIGHDRNQQAVLVTSCDSNLLIGLIGSAIVWDEASIDRVLPSAVSRGLKRSGADFLRLGRCLSGRIFRNVCREGPSCLRRDSVASC
jgi:hypothetical protein